MAEAAKPTRAYELGVDVFFNARHSVASNGVQGPTHVHSWRVQLKLRGSALNADGFLIGFAEAKNAALSEVQKLNGKVLNEVPPFDMVQPTLENIVRVLYDSIKSKLAIYPVELVSLSLWDSPTTYVKCSLDGMV